jgi:hypothetical protein
MTRAEILGLIERASVALERSQRAHETTSAIMVELAGALRVLTSLADELARELHKARKANSA